MTNTSLALLIGGVGAACCFGISGALQRPANVAGQLAVGPYLIVVGLVVASCGLITVLISRETAFSWGAAGWGAAFATLWAVGTAAVAVAVSHFGGRISQLVPLYNANTLIAVGIGLVAFGEWRQVDLRLLIPGAVLTVLGGVLAARA